MSWMSILAKNENTPRNTKSQQLKTKRILNIKMPAKGE